MNLENARKELIEGLKKIVQRTTDAPVTIDDQTSPHHNLGICSGEGVDLACYLSNRLNIVIPEDKNPLYDDRRNKWRTVGQIVEFLDRCKPKENNTNA